jgi:hypothetical protein
MKKGENIYKMISFCRCSKNCSGKLILQVVNRGEQLEKSREFLKCEKQFKQN